MKRLYVVLGLLTLILVLTAIWWKLGTGAKNPADTKGRIFIIAPGQGVRQIAHNLRDEGFIKDQVVFFLLTKQLGLDKEIQAGNYRINPSMDAATIAKALTHGTLDIWITVPEGHRAAEIAETLKSKMPAYEAAWDGVLEANEGYLFPDTYLFPKDSDIDTIVSIMTKNFEHKFNQVSNNSNLTKGELVTLASLIEREARHDPDRPLVSSVIHNRLIEGMALQIDATIQYAKGKTNGKWWEPVTQEEYKSVVSPYNTYSQADLPPGPISNPGLESLMAAAKPANTDYLYYITDKTGTNRYAVTLEEHQANIKKYGL